MAKDREIDVFGVSPNLSLLSTLCNWTSVHSTFVSVGYQTPFLHTLQWHCSSSCDCHAGFVVMLILCVWLIISAVCRFFMCVFSLCHIFCFSLPWFKGHCLCSAERLFKAAGITSKHTHSALYCFRGVTVSCGLHAASGRIKSNPGSVASELERAAGRFAPSC